MNKVIILFLFLFFGCDTKKTQKLNLFDNKLAIINLGKGVILHSFVSDSAASYILESGNKLFLIDTQPHYKQKKIFKDYVNSLNKPIEGLIITSKMRNRWEGADQFKDISIYASDNVLKLLREWKPEIEPNKLHSLNNSELYFDKRKLIIQREQLSKDFSVDVVVLQSLGTVFLGDILSSKSHGMLIPRNREAWIEILNRYEGIGLENYLPGYGASKDIHELKQFKKYIHRAYHLLELKGIDQKGFVERMNEAYPEWNQGFLLESSQIHFKNTK